MFLSWAVSLCTKTEGLQCRRCYEAHEKAVPALRMSLPLIGFIPSYAGQELLDARFGLFECRRVRFCWSASKARAASALDAGTRTPRLSVSPK
jgi:hypothetical protein